MYSEQPIAVSDICLLDGFYVLWLKKRTVQAINLS